MVFSPIKSIYQMRIFVDYIIKTSFKHRHWIDYIIFISHITQTRDRIYNHMIDIEKFDSMRFSKGK